MRTEDYQPGPPATVHTERSENRVTLVFVREFRHSPEKVWAALTDANQVAKWAPFGPSRNLTELGDVSLKMNDGSVPEVYASTVKQIVPNQKLEYSWGESVLSWEIAPSATGTTLTLRHTVENPDWINAAAAGWHICLDIAELLLDGYAIGPIIGKAAMEHGWTQLLEHYTKALKETSAESAGTTSVEESP